MYRRGRKGGSTDLGNFPNFYHFSFDAFPYHCHQRTTYFISIKPFPDFVGREDKFTFDLYFLSRSLFSFHNRQLDFVFPRGRRVHRVKRRVWKKTWGNATNVSTFYRSHQSSKDTHQKAWKREVTQMRAMWQQILPPLWFEKAFESS